MRKPIPSAPAGLGEAGTALWERFTRDFTPESIRETMLLEDLCRGEDLLVKFRATVQAEGYEIKNRFGDARAHPLLLQIHRLELQRVRLLRQLRIPPDDDRPKKLGRPVGTPSWNRNRPA